MSFAGKSFNRKGREGTRKGRKEYQPLVKSFCA